MNIKNKIFVIFVLMILFFVSLSSNLSEIDSNQNSSINKISNSSYMWFTDADDYVPMEPPKYNANVENNVSSQAYVIHDIVSKETTVIPLSPLDITNGIYYSEEFFGLAPLYSDDFSNTVFGADDRLEIPDTTVYPWRTITKIFMQFPDGSHGSCTGCIIGSSDGHGYHVLTAGHCIYSHDNGGWAEVVRVVPGYDDGYMPYGDSYATNIRTYTGWTIDRDWNHDWAVLTLNKSIGDSTGWMGRKTASYTDSMYTGTLNTAGYPGDKGGQTMWFNSNIGRTTNEYKHWYYMDTYGGQSGSPVWTYDGTNRYIITVHAYGDDGSGSNSGTRLNQDKFDRINTWLAEDTPPQSLADLIDDGQAWSGFNPTTISAGDQFFVECDVRNIGTISSGGFYVAYYASTQSNSYLIGEDYVSSIAPSSWADSSWSGSFPDNIPSGTYTVCWVIDSRNNVSELNENNNIVCKSAYQLTVVQQNTPPNVPSSPTPSNSATNQSTNVDISWTCSDPDGDNLTYDVYFEANDSNPALVASGVTSTTYDPGDLQSNTTYYWGIVAKDGFDSTQGPLWSFTTSSSSILKSALYFPRDGYWILTNKTIWTQNPTIDRTFYFGTSSYTPLTGDWDGDGTIECGLYNNGYWILSNEDPMTNNPTVGRTFWFGDSNYLPVVGDWDGDGIDEIGIYSNGYWVLSNKDPWTQNPTADVSFTFGSSIYTPVSGDWDGDGYDEIGIYYPTAQSGFWVLTTKNIMTQYPTADYSFYFGNSSYKPLPGDWDGDGIDEVGLYYSDAVSMFWVLTGDNPSNGLIPVVHRTFYFGNNNFKPLVRDN